MTVPISPNMQLARRAYREVLRAAREAFKDDQRMLRQARIETHRQFSANKALSGSVGAEEGIEHAFAVAQILRQNVVQGESAQGEAHHYKLNIRDSTERGDNDTVKMPKAEPPTPEQQRFKGSAKKFEK
ncbi:hypothetical protein CAC42_7260 [Sphaceloma murrayae]|uniref:Mitochondrial zinc maintenance protein 1, mitochondrial n=1 Tax=Sphaceloma murrayae TaxID=2082308 RepID=A0A2K1QQ40_9PEZI|nr:hypothetical protein CAC42_7260 [Sphaceloma murrayae]